MLTLESEATADRGGSGGAAPSLPLPPYVVSCSRLLPPNLDNLSNPFGFDAPLTLGMAVPSDSAKSPVVVGLPLGGSVGSAEGSGAGVSQVRCCALCFFCLLHAWTDAQRPTPNAQRPTPRH